MGGAEGEGQRVGGEREGGAEGGRGKGWEGQREGWTREKRDRKVNCVPGNLSKLLHW